MGICGRRRIFSMEYSLMSQTGFAAFLKVGVAVISLLPNAIAEESPAHAKDQPANRLAQESSPYLLLHAHNPVDWYPWGPEAFEKAKREEKPIFLSVGYSSCYWCHVMERKVFSDGPIAEFLNEHFVNIKVDREERPDIDDIYMTSLLVYQQLVGGRGGGGWPLSMFLTPEGNPIAGATYLPPNDSPERGPGFLTAATKISTLWNNNREALERSGELMAAQVQRMTRPGVDLEATALNADLVTAAVDEVQEMYDPVWGGVDFKATNPDGPRFPNVPRMELVLDAFEASGDKDLLDIVEQSLLKMARGGIRDHLAGGFHRYSTDRKWLVPHFEKMLYDQAMLLGVYTRTARLSNNNLLAEVAAEIADFVLRDMTTPEGGFCSALDAETNAIEGEYYVWSKQEIQDTLGAKDSSLFEQVYGLNAENSFEHGFVLHLPSPLAAVAAEQKQELSSLEEKLQQHRSKLLEVRSKRERPLLDDKVLTAWNALMIRALAYSGRELQRPQDTDAAARATNFLLTNLRSADGNLLRTWRNGAPKHNGYLDDYAFLVDALLELHTTTNDQKWLEEATKLASQQVESFYDETLQAFYFTSSNHEQLIARTSSVYDSVFASANSVSVRNLIRLDQHNKSSQFRSIAADTLQRFAPVLEKSPASCCGLARSLDLWLTTAKDREADAESVSHVKTIGATLTAASEQRMQSPNSNYILTGSDNDKTPATVGTPDDANPNASTAAVIEQTAFKPFVPGPDDTAAKDEKPKLVKVKIYPLYNKLPRGGKCYVAIELDIKDGWHINANPSNPDYMKPTKVEINTKQKVKLTKLKYPKHHTLQLFETATHVYDGKIMVYGILEIDEKETAKVAELEFHVHFQACNSSECLLPDEVVMKGKLQLAKPGETLKKINEEKFRKLLESLKKAKQS
ncbi:Thioredoxin-related protein [Fuerstiella marisgermanici]|uniref:Thioredoxin-related protein n=2 Tax=Fuerstiella marisgermanici TaxID=1891926 RepID=A0A1P8WN86_9PLAN|nr:Thioredoxin-related protein [Fuerstiella marisgermanici]